MEYDQDARLINFLSGVACGAVIGAGVALLMAPDSGRKTRRKIHRAADDLRDTAYDRWDDLTDDVKARVEEALKEARKGMKRVRG